MDHTIKELFISLYVISITASAFSAKAEKAELQTTKRRSLQQRSLVCPPPRHVKAHFQNIHIFHRPFLPNMIREPWQEQGSLAWVVFFYSVLSVFVLVFFVQSRWNHVIGTSTPFSLGEKRGEAQKGAGVRPSGCSSRGSAHAPGRLRGSWKPGSLRKHCFCGPTTAGRECWNVRVRARADI